MTPLVTIETAERLLRNYAHDGDTKKLVNNLDIFLIPTMNPDGATYSFYDYNWQRKNMTNHCPEELSDFGARDYWGVDLNRNHSIGSVHDGYVGASTNCTSAVYAGPEEHSEPESQNLVWLADEFENIDFAMNIHSYGGYFMWSPGAYDENREPLPRPTAGEEAFYWSASNHILNKIQDHRGTVILPSRTGPIPDVLYSAGGNSADYLWYEKGIYAWNFEVGADLWNEDEERWERVGFQPPYEEGHEEAMEFANGLIGLFEVAYQHSKDHQPPKSEINPGKGNYDNPVEVGFETSEPATVYYTLDGSRPTFESEVLQLGGTREPAETLTVDETTTIKWFSVDPAGNIEKNYNPLGSSQNYNQATINIQE
ncbi:M14 family metallopeptidase [Piscibacillus salipiscarius]|uniref:M14 family metallopeptidase n=1 Tax=Piscibacillus salipiscarius TaxID=299480 RepID=UPI0006CFD50E|nr:M14 family metallopeptidase [Piscibacillus salipiscarius]